MKPHHILLIASSLIASQACYAAVQSAASDMPFSCNLSATNIYDSLSAKVGQPSRADRELILELAIANGVPEPAIPTSYYGYKYYQLAGTLATGGYYVAARNLLTALNEPADQTVAATLTGLNNAYAANSQISDLRNQASTIFGGTYFNNPSVQIFIDGTLYGDSVAIAAGKELICGMRTANAYDENNQLIWRDLVNRVKTFYFAAGLGPDPRIRASDPEDQVTAPAQSNIFTSLIPAATSVIGSVVSSIASFLVDAFSGILDIQVIVKATGQISSEFDKVALVNAKSLEAIATQEEVAKLTYETARIKNGSESGTDNACAAMESSNLSDQKINNSRKDMMQESKKYSQDTHVGDFGKTISGLYEKGLSDYATAEDVSRYGLSVSPSDSISGGDIDANLMYNDRRTGGESYGEEQKKAIEDSIALKTQTATSRRLMSDNRAAYVMDYTEKERMYSAFMSGAQSSYNFIKNQHLTR